MSIELIFYTNPMSRGQIVRWMLEEAQIDYKQVIVEYGPEMKSDDYLAINPMGKVPAIKHGDNVVTECAAICAYVADVFGKVKLAPHVDDRADYYRWLFFTAGPLESAVLNQGLGFKTDEQQQRTAGYGTYELTLNVLDQFLGSRDYVCGEEFSAAEVYLGSQVDWGLMLKTIPETANFNAYAERMRRRPAYQKAKQIDNDLIQQAKTS